MCEGPGKVYAGVVDGDVVLKRDRREELKTDMLMLGLHRDEFEIVALPKTYTTMVV